MNYPELLKEAYEQNNRFIDYVKENKPLYSTWWSNKLLRAKERKDFFELEAIKWGVDLQIKKIYKE